MNWRLRISYENTFSFIFLWGFLFGWLLLFFWGFFLVLSSYGFYLKLARLNYLKTKLL